ncbi:MAG TPA: phage tail protein, partial [Burkholderiales bacterium]|nr:phage tail protein [Burkholderiales bacterium]
GLLFGNVYGWRGPVTAMAIADEADLLIKPALDDSYYRFSADGAYVDNGTLETGPFDAGEDREWERAWAEVQIPPGTTVTVSVACKATSAAPVPGDWVALPSFDALLAQQGAGTGRFASLRVQLSTISSSRSPVLYQARLATATEDLRDYLPLTYSRNETKNGFLSRWLRLLRGEFIRVEESLEDMPRVCDPQFLRASALPWLAQWLSFELPRIASADERRALLARAVQLFARRGSKQSIAELVELYTGVRPAIVEAFAGRRLWVLGESSRVGFDTQLAALDPMGMIVPDESAPVGCCDPSQTVSAGVMGRAIVGESGPLLEYEIGMPLFAEEAYRFCVIVDGYRAHDAATRNEIARIVEREKPAHTDFRIEYIAPEMRVGLQACIGVDAIVGGDPPALQVGAGELGASYLPPLDVARVGGSLLDGTLTLT